MKIAIISDIHLGDENCKLVRDGKVTNTYKELRKKIMEFTDGNPLKYLILNGDVLDFSINSFENSCKIAKPFFQAIKKDTIAEEIIYIPGNHDKQIWDAVEWETNIVRRMKKHEDPRKLRRTQPGWIDYATGRIYLPGVTEVKGRYGTLFLEGLFKKVRHYRLILFILTFT